MRTRIDSARLAKIMSRIRASRKRYSFPNTRLPIWCQYTTSRRRESWWTPTAGKAVVSPEGTPRGAGQAAGSVRVAPHSGEDLVPEVFAGQADSPTDSP